MVSGCIIETIALARLAGSTIDYGVERTAWRSFLGAGGSPTILKPDAELKIDGRGFTDYWWLEIDRGTERAAAVRRQLDAYIAYYRTGHEQRDRGVFPLVAWLTVDRSRAEFLSEVISKVPEDGRPLFRVGLIPEGPRLPLDQFGDAA